MSPLPCSPLRLMYMRWGVGVGRLSYRLGYKTLCQHFVSHLLYGIEILRWRGQIPAWNQFKTFSWDLLYYYQKGHHWLCYQLKLVSLWWGPDSVHIVNLKSSYHLLQNKDKARAYYLTYFLLLLPSQIICFSLHRITLTYGYRCTKRMPLLIFFNYSVEICFMV